MKNALYAALAISAVALLAATAVQADTYTALDLGAPVGEQASAFGLNDAGQVVGAVTKYGGAANYAFITGANGVGMSNLGTLGGNEYDSAAYGINNAGRVVGVSGELGNGGLFGFGVTHAFITGSQSVGQTGLTKTPGGAYGSPSGVVMKDLGTLPGGAYSSAAAINSSGQVVGVADTAPAAGELGGDLHAFITGANGVGMTDLGTLAGHSQSFATGINAAGQVVGYLSGGATERAFITGPNGVGMTDLGALGGSNSYAYGINAAGQVVGYAETLDSAHAFITGPNGVGMIDLGTLFDGTVSYATGINAAGQVVGDAYMPGNVVTHAFITGTNGVGMTDLNTLLFAALADGGYLNGAVAINASGQIVAQDNLGHSYLLTPTVPLPATAWLFGSGVLGLVGVTRRNAEAT